MCNVCRSKLDRAQPQCVPKGISSDLPTDSPSDQPQHFFGIKAAGPLIEKQRSMSSSIVSKTRAWLSTSRLAVGTSEMMPLAPGKKQPMHKHSSGNVWSQERATQFAQDNPEHKEWGLLLDTICVVDADDEAAVAQLEQLATSSVPELSYCPCQQTRKGMHYMFLRPEWADAEGY